MVSRSERDGNVPSGRVVGRRVMAWPKGKPRSAETRARMSAARKAALADPEVRARMSAASKAALATKGRTWDCPTEHARYFAKLIRCGFSRREAREEIERLVSRGAVLVKEVA